MRVPHYLVVFVLLAGGRAASAQTVTNVNNNAYVWGIVNCRFIQVELHQQQQAGGIVTTLQYTVRECPTGSTDPTTTIIQGFLTIPNADYRVQSQQHTLLTRTADGVLQLTWRAVTDRQITFSGTTTDRNQTKVTRTQEDRFHSMARVEGSVGSFPVTAGFSTGAYPAWMSAETTTVR